MAARASYSALFGFDAERRGRWLALLQLDDATARAARELQERVIAPNLERTVDAFYRFLLSHPETRAHLQEPGLVERLRRTQAWHLSSLGVDCHREEYFEERLRVGATHRRVALPLSVYLVAYAHLQSILSALIDEVSSEADERSRLLGAMLKVTTLDILLATETYHGVQLREIEAMVASLRSEEQRLREEATTDALTGIPNRRQLETDLGLALSGSERTAVLMIDLDHFKRINDDHGHPVGDEVLRQSARRIRGQLRDTDSVGRFGGEEFCAILPGADPATMERVAERVRAAIDREPVMVAGVPIRCSVSVGCVLVDRGTPAADAIAHADEALYAAKRGGRNRVARYSLSP